MARSGNDNTGARLGGRIAGIVSDSYLRTRAQLHDTEHRLKVHAAKTVIDNAGHEIADLYRPLFKEALKSGNLHPLIHEHLAKAVSGEHQWQAIAAFALGTSGVGNVLSTVLNNALAPAMYALIEGIPNLIPSVDTIAALTARGMIFRDAGIKGAAAQGINDQWFDAMTQLATAWPDVSTWLELFRRGELTRDQLINGLRVSGIPDSMVDSISSLSRNIVSASDAALAVLRNTISESRGLEIAARAGYTADDFAIIVANTGEPPAVEEMLSLWRRGKITDARLATAIRQSRVRDEWIPEIKELGVMPPTSEEALEAFLKGQVSRDEALKRFTEAGGDPTWFDNAFHTRGSSPSPVELGVMANRGIIPWTGLGPDATSFEQGFHEGQWRNKWEPAMRGLATYWPPARTVTAMVKEGALTKQQAFTLWKGEGLPDWLVNAYYDAATLTKTTKHRELAEATIVKLYSDQGISRTVAHDMLVGIRYDPAEAEFILEVADLQREAHALEQAVGRAHNMYVAFKIDAQRASAALAQLGLPSPQVEHMLRLWTFERDSNVKTLTEGQIAAAFFYNILNQDEAMAELESLGFTPLNAWVILSVRAHKPLPGRPA